MSISSLYQRLVPTRSRRAVMMASLLFGSVLSYLVFSRVIFGVVTISGTSMEPTLPEGGTFLMHRWPLWLGAPGRGDIVAIKDPLDEGMSVKRLIGLPSETIELDQGNVIIDGEPLDEIYLYASIRTDPYDPSDRRFECQPDHYFVMGDNRTNSVDGRLYGPIHVERIRGLIRP